MLGDFNTGAIMRAGLFVSCTDAGAPMSLVNVGCVGK